MILVAKESEAWMDARWFNHIVGKPGSRVWLDEFWTCLFNPRFILYIYIQYYIYTVFYSGYIYIFSIIYTQYFRVDIYIYIYINTVLYIYIVLYSVLYIYIYIYFQLSPVFDLGSWSALRPGLPRFLRLDRRQRWSRFGRGGRLELAEFDGLWQI